MSRVRFEGAFHENDPVWRLEMEIGGALRLQGAMRAVSCVLESAVGSGDEEVKHVGREDLAALFDVFQQDLEDRLRAMEEHVQLLHGVEQIAATVTERARRAPWADGKDGATT